MEPSITQEFRMQDYHIIFIDINGNRNWISETFIKDAKKAYRKALKDGAENAQLLDSEFNIVETTAEYCKEISL
jgi:hypothetical protein